MQDKNRWGPKASLQSSHLIQKLHLAESEKLIAKNVFGVGEGFLRYLLFQSSADMKSPN